MELDNEEEGPLLNGVSKEIETTISSNTEQLKEESNEN